MDSSLFTLHSSLNAAETAASTPLELLAPARNPACGMAAIDHGADAVYIGAERFGARAAAGNSVDDIAALCRYAHNYAARVYVTVNTIVYDNELRQTRELLQRLQEAGVDAVLVQDMAVLKMLPEGMTAHASTQTDNRTKEKMAWLASVGFSRAVVARELSVDEIGKIHRSVPQLELEAFVHGALCTSYSGQCYASQYCFKRSANRGECAQFCRLKFDLLDAEGRVIEADKHLLSLKDMCRIDHIDELAEAGVTSFKIEGRLKDVAYVKNVTAAYSLALDRLVAASGGKYRRASLGRCRYTFSPDPAKTFNRGYTDYFLHGREGGIESFLTPKATGEPVAIVRERRRSMITVSQIKRLANGDGLCFITDEGTGTPRLEGFRVNRVNGFEVYPQLPATLPKPGTKLYRNNDHAFNTLLSQRTATRKIAISMSIMADDHGYTLHAAVPGVAEASVSVAMEMQTAEKPQSAAIADNLRKLGNTPFECDEPVLTPAPFPYFIPMSSLAEARRQLTTRLSETVARLTKQTAPKPEQPADNRLAKLYLDGIKPSFTLNCANAEARKFYAGQGIGNIQPAYELSPVGGAVLMRCKHCLLFSLGYCRKRSGKQLPWPLPLYLRSADGRRFRLDFDCSRCEMLVCAE